MPAMSFSLSQDPTANPSPITSEGPRFLLWPSEDTTTVRAIPSTTSDWYAAVTSTTQAPAPQFIQTSLSSSITRSAQSSQPLLTIAFPTSTSSRLPESTSSVASAPIIISVASTSSISSTAFDGFVSSSLPLSSTSTLLPTVTSAPESTSWVTVASTTPTSSSTEATSSSVTPLATTVTESVESPTPSPSAAPAENTETRDVGHHAPFYIAVVVGSILAIGLIAAVIAWAVRLRMHARRRRDNPEVPWANHHDDDDELEAGRDATFIGQPIDRIGSKDISSQDATPWDLTGVGEPRRSNSYVRSSLHSSMAPSLPQGPYEYQPYPHPARGVAYPAPLYHGHGTRDTYSDTDTDRSLDGHGSASSLGPLQVTNMTPGDASPLSSCASTPVTMYTARSSGSGQYEFQHTFSEPHREDVPQSSQWADGGNSWNTVPLPSQTPNSTEETITDDSSWTSSIKSNLTQAFNAVAASLPAGPVLMINRQDRGAATSRRSLDSVFSRNNSIGSKSWTLEERDDGTGRVHFHDLENDNYETRPAYATLDSSSAAQSRRLTRDANRLVTRLPQSAMLRPGAFNPHERSPRQPSMRSSLSTASSTSAYSMASGLSGAHSPAPRLPALSRHSTIKMDPMTTVYEKKEEDDGFYQQRPTLATRSSSSGCSVTSYYFGADGARFDSGESTESDKSVQQALVDRRRKLRRII